uniref:Ovule protein n=1 Tax=Steinernema glaseri TaxID=37863 RepID=A0A1I7Z075_9BILA
MKALWSLSSFDRLSCEKSDSEVNLNCWKTLLEVLSLMVVFFCKCISARSQLTRSPRTLSDGSGVQKVA